MSVLNVECQYVYNTLKSVSNSYLIDVRSMNEWKFDGIPDLSYINKKTFLIEWPTFLDDQFIKIYTDQLNYNFNKLDKLFFICKSGIRSAVASQLSINIGFKFSYNVFSGFVSLENSNKTWKEKLPWKHYN